MRSKGVVVAVAIEEFLVELRIDCSTISPKIEVEWGEASKHVHQSSPQPPQP